MNKYRKIIRSVISEDLSWLSRVKTPELGDSFTEGDVYYGENENYVINIDGDITFNIDSNEYDKYDFNYEGMNWLDLALGYGWDWFEDYMDMDDESPYFWNYLNQENKLKITEYLMRVGYPKNFLEDKLINEEVDFLDFSKFLPKDYITEFEYLCNDIGYSISNAVTRNRLIELKDCLDSLVSGSDIIENIDSVGSTYKFTVKPESILHYNLSELLEEVVEEFNDANLDGCYYNGFNTEGVDEEINDSVLRFFDSIEEDYFYDDNYEDSEKYIELINKVPEYVDPNQTKLDL